MPTLDVPPSIVRNDWSVATVADKWLTAFEISVALKNVAWDEGSGDARIAKVPADMITAVKPNNVFMASTLPVQVNFKSKGNFEAK